MSTPTTFAQEAQSMRAGNKSSRPKGEAAPAAPTESVAPAVKTKPAPVAEKAAPVAVPAPVETKKQTSPLEQAVSTGQVTEPTADPVPDFPDIVVGKPVEAAKTEEPKAVAETKTPVEVEAAKIKVGNREFKSQDELLSYFTELERKALASEAYLKGATEALATKEAPAPAEPEIDLEEMMFSDPKKFIAHVTAEAERKALVEIDKRDSARAIDTQVKNSWDGFYRTNSDLVDMQDQVLIETQRLLKERGPSVPETEALSIIATRTREYAKKIADRFAPATELPSAPATTSGTSQASSGAAAPTKVLDFVSQMRKFQRRA